MAYSTIVTANTLGAIMRLIYSATAGKMTMGNTGGSSEIEQKFYNYVEGAVIATRTVLKPDSSDNTETLDANAMAGRET